MDKYTQIRMDMFEVTKRCSCYSKVYLNPIAEDLEDICNIFENGDDKKHIFESYNDYKETKIF